MHPSVTVGQHRQAASLAAGEFDHEPDLDPAIFAKPEPDGDNSPPVLQSYWEDVLDSVEGLA